MKPLVRWTMGSVSEEGWEVLLESIRMFSKVYPEFDQVICHNNLSPQEQERLALFGVPLYEQKAEAACFPFVDASSGEAISFAWKLLPPRLRPEAHELWIDNDIVIRERISALDAWLSSSTTAVISYNYCSEDYGRFTKEVLARVVHLDNKTYCAGLFGLPPYFDFASKIIERCGDEPLLHYDEQGLVSLIVSDGEYALVDINMVGSWTPKQYIRRMFPNIHFTRINQKNNVKYPSWRYYKLFTVP